MARFIMDVETNGLLDDVTMDHAVGIQQVSFWNEGDA